jgi:hypothetical protein
MTTGIAVLLVWFVILLKKGRKRKRKENETAKDGKDAWSA